MSDDFVLLCERLRVMGATRVVALGYEAHFGPIVRSSAYEDQESPPKRSERMPPSSSQEAVLRSVVGG